MRHGFERPCGTLFPLEKQEVRPTCRRMERLRRQKKLAPVHETQADIGLSAEWHMLCLAPPKSQLLCASSIKPFYSTPARPPLVTPERSRRQNVLPDTAIKRPDHPTTTTRRMYSTHRLHSQSAVPSSSGSEEAASTLASVAREPHLVLE